MEKEFDLNGLQVSTVMKPQGGIQIVITNLLVEAELKLLVAERARMGWVMCQLRKLMAEKLTFL